MTFDDGPSDFTIQILDILKEENVHATFFMNSYDKDDPFHADRLRRPSPPTSAPPTAS